ncbi:MAG: transposase, partial [Gammaproteobacteria bacterium]|nr:transposase [Gammaproteobacteria bacterium]
MAKRQRQQGIPTELTVAQYFVLPHLTVAKRGPVSKLSLYRSFAYILKWLPIEKNESGRPEIPYTCIYSVFRRWESDGCMNAIFVGSVLKLHQNDLLNIRVIHGDGTTTSAKKGGDNIGYSGHKHMKGDKIVAFCVRYCNVIAPIVKAPGNRNESPLFREALPLVTEIA